MLQGIFSQKPVISKLEDILISPISHIGRDTSFDVDPWNDAMFQVQLKQWKKGWAVCPTSINYSNT
jgi:hypothetical protein